MDNLITVTGMVLQSSPVGEKDLRLVLLTAERGRITVFARGAKNPKSPLIAGSRPFSFGQFRLHEGEPPRRAGDENPEVFRGTDEGPGGCHAWLLITVNFAAYYGREGIDERGESICSTPH